MSIHTVPRIPKGEMAIDGCIAIDLRNRRGQVRPRRWRARADRLSPPPVGTKHGELDLGDVTLHWAEAGEGPPVLLLHGLNDSHRTWRELWRRLPGRRVLMLDLPGHGLSGRPDAPYTLDWNATQVARWIERLDLRDLDLVGHSYGGGVAQFLLLKCRQRIRRLALLCSGGLGREVYPWLRIASLPYLLEAFGQPWIAPVARLAMARATTSDARAEAVLLSSYLRQPGSARAFSRTVRDVIRWRGQTRNLFDRIADIAGLPPVRLFWGARDRILPISQGVSLAALLTNCKLVRFESSGHFVHWEQPEALAYALRAFFEEKTVPSLHLTTMRRTDERLRVRRRSKRTGGDRRAARPIRAGRRIPG
jgi:pimeloyl-ACP methyl ester carboxylesterase